jgi:hypothetical protein
MTDQPAPSPDVETAVDVLFDALDAEHDKAYHIHAAECCWPFVGVRAALATALRGAAGLPERWTPCCIHCGDPVAWHPGNGGQWLGAVPPRDWARCNGIPGGQQHEAPLAALRGAGLPEPSGGVTITEWGSPEAEMEATP